MFYFYHMPGEQKKKAELKISGMHCATCAINIEESLSKVESVSNAQVNFGTDTAHVEFDPAKVSIKDLEKAVTDAGYEVVNREAVIRVGGMVCATCVQTIEAALRALPGVASATVNLGTEKAYVIYNPSVTGVPEMKFAIEDAGYQYLGLAGEISEEAEKKAREKDLHDKLVRFSIGFAVSIPLMLMMWVPLPVTMQTMAYIMFIIATPVFVYVAYPIFRAAHMALRNRSLNMDVMYAMGTGIAYGSSVLGTFNIVLDPGFMFYDAAIMLASFLILGRYLEAKAKGRTSEAIKKLAGLGAKNAIVLRNGVEEEIPVEDVVPGDIVVVKPGAKVPVDGEVAAGESYVNEAMITGEPVPPLKRTGGPGCRGHDKPEQCPKCEGAEGGKRDGPRTDYPAGRGCTGVETTGAENCRHRGNLLYPGSIDYRRCYIRCMVLSPRGQPAFRTYGDDLRACGCLSVCTGPGNTNCGDRRCGTGCRTWDFNKKW